ncbi:MAG TPA: 50S ribosomal protein L21 [Candidatus Limnocylindrales bacterium]|jgi:large subunit ribosomal protein L21|nr:50S ribosomal protein L21 [Candidatus Limnocylindrales bacterium]
MYAVIESGGKQYRVEVGTELEVELLDVEAGQALTLDRVLLVADGDETAIGRPLVENASVEAEVVRRDRGPKLIVFKYRPKARRRVKKGHRQDHTVLRITDVRLGSKSAAAAVRKAEQVAKSERERLEEAATRQAAADAALAAKLAKSKAADEAKASKTTAGTAGTTAKTAPKNAPKAAPKTTSKTTSPKAKATTSKTSAADAGTTAPKRGTAKTQAPGTRAAPRRSRTKKDE